MDGESMGTNSGAGDGTAGATGRERNREQSRGTTRRAALKGAGTLAVGLVGLGAPSSPARGQSTDFDGRTWQSDHPEIRSRPLYQLCFPGTHHAAMYEGHDWVPDAWSLNQRRRVGTQLADGIRYFDIRVESQGDGEGTHFHGHHGGAGDSDDSYAETGAPFSEVFGDMRGFLDEVAARDANEFAIVKLSHFWDEGFWSDDEFESDDWRELRELLQNRLGPYLLDLGEWSRSELLTRTLADFDGPRVLVLYDGGQQPGFVGERDAWIDYGWLNEQRPGLVYRAAMENTYTTDPSTPRLGSTQWLVTPPAEAIVTSWADSQFDSLHQAAVRTNALLPGFVERVKADPSLNPNVLAVDFYETSNVVQYARELSAMGLHTDRSGAPPVDDGTYRVESVQTGRVADVRHSGTENGDTIWLWDWNGSGAQRFRFERLGDGTYRIENENSGKFADVSGWGTDNGDNVHQWDWHGGDNQRWYVAETEREGYALIAKHSGRVFDASDTDPGSTIHQWEWHTGENQRWRLDEV